MDTPRTAAAAEVVPERAPTLSLRNVTVNRVLVYLFLGLYAALVLVPILIIVSASLDPAGLLVVHHRAGAVTATQAHRVG